MRGPSPTSIADTRRMLSDYGIVASDEHIRSMSLWRERRQRRAGSVDRLTARVVWGRFASGARAWRTLAIAGPRGGLP